MKGRWERRTEQWDMEIVNPMDNVPEKFPWDCWEPTSENVVMEFHRIFHPEDYPETEDCCHRCLPWFIEQGWTLQEKEAYEDPTDVPTECFFCGEGRPEGCQ